MELIVINESKLKIIMNAQEMEIYGLDENEFHLCVSDTRKILSKILHNSPLAQGFALQNPSERLLLQMYPEKQGGCELYVTRLSTENDYICKEEGIMQANEGRMLSAGKGANSEKKASLICYRFERLSDICSLCRELKKRGFDGDCSLYTSRNGEYFIIVKQKKDAEENRVTGAIMSEFGELCNADQALLKLGERGKCICQEKTVDIFSEL